MLFAIPGMLPVELNTNKECELFETQLLYFAISGLERQDVLERGGQRYTSTWPLVEASYFVTSKLNLKDRQTVVQSRE